ncbi:MAG: acyl-CoA dehydrogenase C-terminal domain-containing protein, partial [Pseudomonadota bacterium]
IGVASGALFGAAAVGYRAASTSLDGPHFLMQAGYTIGGWLSARATAAALEQRDSGTAGTDFYDARIATGRFYSAGILPRARAHGAAARADTTLVTQLDEALF